MRMTGTWRGQEQGHGGGMDRDADTTTATGKRGRGGDGGHRDPRGDTQRDRGQHCGRPDPTSPLGPPPGPPPPPRPPLTLLLPRGGGQVVGQHPGVPALLLRRLRLRLHTETLVTDPRHRPAALPAGVPSLCPLPTPPRVGVTHLLLAALLLFLLEFLQFLLSFRLFLQLRRAFGWGGGSLPHGILPHSSWPHGIRPHGVLPYGAQLHWGQQGDISIPSAPPACRPSQPHSTSPWGWGGHPLAKAHIPQPHSDSPGGPPHPGRAPRGPSPTAP